MIRSKVYVSVDAQHRADRECCLKSIKPADGSRYEIDEALLRLRGRRPRHPLYRADR